jgi:hypothetical protein
MAFVKVVEGSDIYNFPIHHFLHFYSKFWSFTCSNSGTAKRNRVSRCRAGLCAATSRRLGVCASAAPPEATRHPSPCTFPRSTRAPRRSKPAPLHALARHPHRTTAGRVPHGPAVYPWLSSLVRRTTAEVHHLSSREQVSFLFKRSPSRASTELAGRHCRSSPSSPLR